MTHFTRKSVAKTTKAVDGDNCLSAAQAADSFEYETILFVPMTHNGILATALHAYYEKKKKGSNSVSTL